MPTDMLTMPSRFRPVLKNTTMGDVMTLDASIDTTAIRKAVMDGRKMKVLPYAEWMKFSRDEIRMLLHETATYVVPTEELIDYLDDLIGDERTIEVGAGNGYIGSELDIKMTDSYQQKDDPIVVAYYKMMGQPTIKYPKSVIKMDAIKTARNYRPHTILGCYLTHKWDEATGCGNDKGIDFFELFAFVKRIILVGNQKIHGFNPFMQVPHAEIELPGLLTRSMDDRTNRIYVWQKIER